MKKEIYTTIKGEKVIVGYVDSNKQFTFREDIDMSIISKKSWERLGKMYNVNQSDYLPIIPICSDKELKEIAEQWCELVGEEPTVTTLNAFCMGAKIAISNNGWVNNQNQNKDEYNRNA